MSRKRGKTSGWAAFDHQQRHKDSLEARISNEAFPSLPSKVQPDKSFSRNKQRQVKSFSSVILPSLEFSAPLKENMNFKSSGINSSEVPQISQISLINKNDLVSRQLKELFDWADDSLIEDVMAAAGNDFDKVSSLLKAMVSDQSAREHEKVEVTNSSFDIMEPVANGKMIHEQTGVSLKDMSKSTKTWTALKPCVGNNIKNVPNEFTLSSEKLFDDCMEFNAMLSQLTSVPFEPEWEEDDVYLSSRKDAIKMMRAATRHSKAATNSFLRGDHISAQQFSLKAREEWQAAQSLNAKAACDILNIRNENNGVWRLDLHGLHASEAVQAVEDRLHMIETQGLSEGLKPSEPPNRFRNKTEELCASYSDGYNNLGKLENRATNRLKPIWLEIITGIGNHSRGGAALPTAVRNFLADNGYRFDEARPGAIMVRPKFRLS